MPHRKNGKEGSGEGGELEANFVRQELPVHTIAKMYWLAGHARVYVSFDLLFRYLKHKGYKVSELAAHFSLHRVSMAPVRIRTSVALCLFRGLAGPTSFRPSFSTVMLLSLLFLILTIILCPFCKAFAECFTSSFTRSVFVQVQYVRNFTDIGEPLPFGKGRVLF